MEHWTFFSRRPESKFNLLCWFLSRSMLNSTNNLIHSRVFLVFLSACYCVCVKRITFCNYLCSSFSSSICSLFLISCCFSLHLVTKLLNLVISRYVSLLSRYVSLLTRYYYLLSLLHIAYSCGCFRLLLVTFGYVWLLSCVMF